MNKHDRLINESLVDQLSLTKQILIKKISVFYLAHQLGKIGKPSLEQHSKIPVFNPCVNWGK